MLQYARAAGEPIDPLDLYTKDERRREDRPWVMLNMISTLDGGTAVSGKSSELGDDDDSDLFKAIRTVPDVILVGAATATAEDYRPVTLDAERRERRAELGKAETPTLAIVSGRLSVDPDARLFGDPDHKPLLITSTNADPSKLVLIGDSADVVILPDLDPATILNHLGAARVVLIEGGPTLNGQFARDGLIDEINLTTSPTLLSGDSARIVRGPQVIPPQTMTIDRVLLGEHLLFVRYLRKKQD